MAIRVLIVEDSLIMRKVIETVLAEDDEITVIGSATNGLIALEMIRKQPPDLVTLDIEMPEMDGLSALTEIRKFNKTLPIIMLSSMTKRGAEQTMKALMQGANDYMEKPSNLTGLEDSIAYLREGLIPKIKALNSKNNSKYYPHKKNQTQELSIFKNPKSDDLNKSIQSICIGVSTGGPMALVELFEFWKTALPVPIFIVQHMPPKFTELLANRLSTLGATKVIEPYDGQTPEPGFAYMAPGGWHMKLISSNGVVKIQLNEEPPVNSCRPSVDILFKSAALVYPSGVLALVLTGMGTDGLNGAKSLVDSGSTVWVQDESTSTIWGMPGSVANAGLAERVVALDLIPKMIQTQLGL